MTSRGIRAALVAALAVVVLTACSPQVDPGGNPVTDARAHFEGFVSAVADVQAVIHDDAWTTTDYGDAPESCTLTSYQFSMRRDAPSVDVATWRIPGGPVAMSEQVVEHLGASGWKDVRAGASGAAMSVTAAKPDAGVRSITVLLHPGEVTDTVDVTAESVCFDGDAERINDELFGGSIEIDRSRYPASEKPGDPPQFGYPAE